MTEAGCRKPVIWTTERVEAARHDVKGDPYLTLLVLGAKVVAEQPNPERN